MPGFCGIVNRETGWDAGEAVVRLGRMADADWNGGGLERRVWAGRNAVVSMVDLPSGFLSGKTAQQGGTGWTRFLYGEIWDGPETRRRVMGDGFDPEDDAGYLLAVYRSRGEAGLAELSGSFSAVLVDEVSGDIILVTDCYGTRGLFYASGSKELLFSSSMRPILELMPSLRAAIDWTAVGEFLTLDYSLGDRTQLEGIRLVPPASTAVIRNGRMEIRKYWKMTYTTGNCPSDYRGQVEMMNAVFLDTFPRIAGHRTGGLSIGSFLSGGLDSRTAAGLTAEKYPLTTHTFAEKGCVETSYAAAVSKAIGAPHHVYTLTPWNVSANWPLGIALTDGLMACRHYHGLAYYGDIAGRAGAILDGFLGDLVTGRLIGDFSPVIGDGSRLAESMFGFMAVGFREFTKLLSEGPGRHGKELADAVFDDFRSALDRIEAPTPIQRAEVFNFSHRQVKFISQHCVRMPAAFMRIKNPFASREMRDFFLSLPLESRVGQRIYKDSIRELLPNLAAIPTSTTGGPLLPATLPILVSNMAFKLRRRVRRNIRELAPHLIKPFPWSYPAYGWWIGTDLRKLYRTMLLSSDSRVMRYFDGKALARTLDSQQDGKENHELLLSSLMAFELWHRMYLDGVPLDELTMEIERLNGRSGVSGKRYPGKVAERV